MLRIDGEKNDRGVYILYVYPKGLHFKNSLFFMFSILLDALQFVSLNMTYLLIARVKICKFLYGHKRGHDL